MSRILATKLPHGYHTTNSINCSIIPIIIRKLSSVQLVRDTFESAGKSREACPLIVMHGLFGSRVNWRDVCKAFQSNMDPKRKIISVDARNHGESPHNPEHTYRALASDIVQVLEDEKIDKAAVIGHSMGGRAMMYLALQFPELVDRVIIVDISPVHFIHHLNPLAKRLFQEMKKIKVPSHLSMEEARHRVNAVLRRNVKDTSSVDIITLNLKKCKKKGFFWSVNVDALQKNFYYISRFPLDEINGSQYLGPILFLGGTKSNFLRDNEIDRVQHMFPHAQLSWIEGGHLLYRENTEEFLNFSLRFLNSTM